LTNLANVDVGATTTFTATGVGAGTYYMRVRARNGCGASPPGNEIVATVVAVPGPGAPLLDTPERVYAFLRGKTIVQAGSDIPEYPNGAHESVACFSRVTLIFLDTPGTWQVTVQAGTITNNTCNKNVVSNTFGPFTDNYVVSGVQQNAACFNIDVRGANQSGRGSIDSLNRTVSWELYQNALNPLNHRCGNGPPGAPGVTLFGASFQGNAVQVWRY